MSFRFQVALPLAVLSVLFAATIVSAQAKIDTVVDRASPLETVSTDFGLADGPAWDGYALMIPDVKDQKLFRYIPAKKEMSVFVPEAGRISASFFNHGRLFLSDNPNGQIAFLDGKTKVPVTTFDKIKQADEKPYRPNDLVVDQHGGMYVTFTPQNKVIYIDAEGKQSVAVDGIDTPNGITMSPDEKTLYVSSFIPKKIWAYQITKPGQTVNARQFASMDKGPERGADGMTIDRAGNIYCAGPKHIWIWRPGGALVDKIECPAKPINCAFGDSDMRTLYITGPGGLYRQRMKIPGRSSEPASLELQPVAENPKKLREGALSTKLDGVKSHLNVEFASYGNVATEINGKRKLLADIFEPAKSSGTSNPCLVVVHGGGWKQGDKTKFRALAIELARRGYVTMAIEYRLSSESAFPASAFDCLAAVRFLRANADQYAIDPDRIGAVGGSAGGHLVGLMASGGGNPKLQGDGGNQDHSARISAAIVMAGPMQMVTGSVADRSEKKDSNANVWLRGSLAEKPELYRLADAHVQIDESTCPILFMVGEHDNPERNELSREKLNSLGIATGLKTYKNGEHGCWNRNPWFDLMVEDMDQFFKEHLK